MNIFPTREIRILRSNETSEEFIVKQHVRATRAAKNHERRLITGGRGKRRSRTCRRLLETNDSVGRIWRSYRLR